MDHTPIRRLGPEQAAVLYLAFSVPSRRAVPRALEQRIVLANASRPLRGPGSAT